MFARSIFVYSILAHIALVILFLTGSAVDWVLLFVGYFLFRCLGTSMMYHRYYAHASWNPTQWFKIIATWFATLSGEGSPITWTAWHLTHHRYSDTDQDPHSPLHMTKFRCWMLAEFSDINIKFGVRLLRDPVAVFFHKNFWYMHLLWATIIGVIYPYGIISFYLAPAALTWSLGAANNIFSHLYGSQPHATGDNSRNNWINGIIGFGEGWHNNHHHNPTHYRHGTEPTQPDLGAWLIEHLDNTKKH